MGMSYHSLRKKLSDTIGAEFLQELFSRDFPTLESNSSLWNAEAKPFGLGDDFTGMRHIVPAVGTTLSGQPFHLALVIEPSERGAAISVVRLRGERHTIECTEADAEMAIVEARRIIMKLADDLESDGSSSQIKFP